MKLRPYSPGDEAALATLWFESWCSTGLRSPVVTRQELAARIPKDVAERWDTVVAEEDGRLLGFLALAPKEQRLDQLFVAPDAQGRGIGGRLLAIAKQRLQHGFWLSTQPENSRARAFYERAGLKFDRAEHGDNSERVFYTFSGRDP